VNLSLKKARNENGEGKGLLAKGYAKRNGKRKSRKFSFFRSNLESNRGASKALGKKIMGQILKGDR